MTRLIMPAGPRIGRGLAPWALLAAVSCLGFPAAAQAKNPALDAPPPMLQPAGSLEGNYLSAYIAGAARDTTAAATFYREALKADPRNPELLERAFVSLLADGAMTDAFRAAERMVQREGNSNGLAHLALGIRSLKNKQYASARSSFAKGGRGRAADLTSTLLTAWAHAGAGEGRKALETADKLKGERAFNVFRDYHAGLIAEVTGNLGEAEKRLKSAYETERTTLRIVDAYGRLEARRGQRQTALATYEAFDQLLPRHPLIRDAMGLLAGDKPLPPLVANAQEGAAEVLYGLGSAGGGSGDELPTIIYLRLALYLDPEHQLALVMLGEVFERLKQLDRANEIFNRVPDTSPLRTNAEIQIGLNLEQLGRGDEAAAHLEALLKKNPEDLEVISALGNVLRSRKRYAEAAETYTKAIDLIGKPDRGNWILFYYRGASYERAKQWEKAEADLKKALELVPDTNPSAKAQVLNYLAYTWVDQNVNIDPAFEMLKKAVELSPRDGMIIDSLGWAYYRLGRYEDAVRELEKAVELKPGDPVINDHLGDAYWRTGRRLEAGFQWAHARDANPEPDDAVKIAEKLKNGLPDEPNPAAAETAPPVDLKKNGG